MYNINITCNLYDLCYDLWIHLYNCLFLKGLEMVIELKYIITVYWIILYNQYDY